MSDRATDANSARLWARMDRWRENMASAMKENTTSGTVSNVTNVTLTPLGWSVQDDGMTTDDRPDYGTVWVCHDCYVAHHYGGTEHDGQWFVGDSDTPCDRDPLSRLVNYRVTDNTDSETGDGIDEFSWSSCDGCESNLGGSRYRMAVWEG